ncbi:MAG: hypothetical protein FWF50_05445 [Defluviitaleaceae bacterium]|nr:hypothetical protein [Defluviitaleaceae bacterium]
MKITIKITLKKKILPPPPINVSEVIKKASSLPTIKIDRKEYIRKNFENTKYANKIGSIINDGPIKAGVPLEYINKLAKKSIANETLKVSAISFAAGVPGVFAMAATISTDMAQFYGHILRISQKLAYLYGIEDIETLSDDGSENTYILFLGVMFGVQQANNALKAILIPTQAHLAKHIANQALTKGTIYPIIKETAKILGIRMTKQIFAKGVSKTIPIVGGISSGGLSLIMFKSMAGRLHKNLQELTTS